MTKEFSSTQLAVFVLMPQAIESFEEKLRKEGYDTVHISLIKDLKNPRNRLYSYLGVAAVGMIALARSNRTYKTCTGATVVVIGLGLAGLSAKRLCRAASIFQDLMNNR